MKKGAKVSILAMYLHPSRLTSTTLPNIELNRRLGKCTVIGIALKKVSKCDQIVIVMKYSGFIAQGGASEESHSILDGVK